MQHTLVPPQDRKRLRHEYHVRAWIVALFAISAAGVIGVAALFPSFMKGTFEERLQLEAVAALEKSKNEKGITAKEHELAADKQLLITLSDGLDKKMLSAELEQVFNDRGTVQLNNIGIARQSDGSVRILIQGIAPTREALLGYKSKLENQVMGTMVTLPISQLAKSTHIQFSMEVTRPKQ